MRWSNPGKSINFNGGAGVWRKNQKRNSIISENKECKKWNNKQYAHIEQQTYTNSNHRLKLLGQEVPHQLENINNARIWSKLMVQYRKWVNNSPSSESSWVPQCITIPITHMDSSQSNSLDNMVFFIRVCPNIYV